MSDYGIFVGGIKKTIAANSVSCTENGAIGFKTTASPLLDLNFALSSLRSAPEAEVIDMFSRAYSDDPQNAIAFLFYSRNIRGTGCGERTFFRVCFNWLLTNHTEVATAVMDLIPHYGRWDDLVYLVINNLNVDYALCVIRNQFFNDYKAMERGESISLLAKWLPSEHSKKDDNCKAAAIISSYLDLTPKQYRKTLTRMRAYLKVVEVNMSANEWTFIDYPRVPSRAMLIYREAFAKHDPEGYRRYIEAVERGEEKINAGTLFPHDIVAKYSGSSIWTWAYYATNGFGARGNCPIAIDATLEELWKNLPDTVQGEGSTLCVQDGSGSMRSAIGGTSVTALDVSMALSIYFAERCSGAFKNRFLTFGANPVWTDLNQLTTLRDKIARVAQNSDCSNTNVEKVFDMILATAVTNKLRQDEIPARVLVISDMEFDSAMCYPNQRLFETITRKYASYGYQLPKLIFWNVNSSTRTIPVIQNDLGVVLVSGFSTGVIKMALSGKLDPLEALLEVLNGEEFAIVHSRIEQYFNERGN